MILSGIHVFITAGFPLKACGNDILYKRLNVQLVFAKSLSEIPLRKGGRGVVILHVFRVCRTVTYLPWHGTSTFLFNNLKLATEGTEARSKCGVASYGLRKSEAGC